MTEEAKDQAEELTPAEQRAREAQLARADALRNPTKTKAQQMGDEYPSKEKHEPTKTKAQQLGEEYEPVGYSNRGVPTKAQQQQ